VLKTILEDVLKINLCASILILAAAAVGFSSCAKNDVNSSATPAAQTQANTPGQQPVADVDESDSALDELDPNDPNIEAKLAEIDQVYQQETGLSAHLRSPHFFSMGCRREMCAVYARVEKSEQKLYLYVNGNLQAVFATSTGVPGRGTPNFDTHPDGRIYDRYTSTKFPGGDFNGLGNMPYAVFISGGFAIHGTGKSNWKKLGRVASHGCIRIHPDNALIFNRLVRQYGGANTWITVE
jgi:hypothetical protein